ncbi:hypothetical protein CBL_12950 [Carabus blaptoides fortunei]
MDSKLANHPKRVLKKVKDFENIHDYFNYVTTEFGNENIQFSGYKWTADDLYDLYLAGDKEAVLKLALPESTDFSDLPFIKSSYDKPDRLPLQGTFLAEDTVKFPCKPAQKCVEKYFEAKEWDNKLMEHPRFMNLWPNRHTDLGFAKVELMNAKQNLIVTKQKYEESLTEMKKDKEELKKKSDELREFTITFNNLAFRNIYNRVESEKKINAHMELNFKKLNKGKNVMKNIETMIDAQEDMKVRIEKMQIYEDFLNRVVESSAGKYDNIQQILDRYDSVAFMKRQIVRNHVQDMFKMDVLQGKLMRYISERQDIVRNYNNQMANLDRRYKFVQKRYFHWKNAVHRMKKLCNRERAQTQSVEASIWNLYVQMCMRKKMPIKEKKGNYKTQLAYILITIKQYEKIAEIAEEKYELYLRSRTNSSMSARKEGDKIEEVPVGTTFLAKKSVETQTKDVTLVEASTMIWWEDEVQMTTSAIPPSPQNIEEKALEVEDSKMKETTEEEKILTDQITLVEEPKTFKVDNSMKEPKLRLIETLETLKKEETIQVSRLDKLEIMDRQLEHKSEILKESCDEKSLSDLDTSVAIQTDQIDTQDKGHQYELFVSIHCQTLNDDELEELQELHQQLDAEKQVLDADEQEVAWLKRETELNIKLMRPSRKKIVEVRRRAGKSPYVKLESTGSIHSGESIKSKGLEEWDDSAAHWFYPQEWGEPLDVLLHTGRRMSTSMKELSSETVAARDSELEPPIWGEFIADGILRRLQEALSSKEQGLDDGADRRESIWTEETKSEERKTSTGKEEIITQVAATKYVKTVEKQQLDYHQIYLKDMNLVDAWTQTLHEQTEDWTQTLPLREQYGWTQTETINQIIQTDEQVKQLSVEYTEVYTQTDVSPVQKHRVEKITVDEETKSSEMRKLSVQLKHLSRSELKSEEEQTRKRMEVSAKVLQTSVESDDTFATKASGRKSLKPLKPATKKKSLTSVKTIAASQKTMITMQEAISSVTANEEGTKKLVSKRLKGLPRLALKKTPSKPLVSTLQPLISVPKITRPCKQTAEMSVSHERISTGVKKEDKRSLQKFQMTKSNVRVSWSGHKVDSSAKSLLPDVFTEMSSISSSSSSNMTKLSKKPITKEKLKLDDLVDKLSKSSLDTQEEYPSLGSLEEKQWSYASSTSSANRL